MSIITVYGNEIEDNIKEIDGFIIENHSHEVIKNYRRIGGTENFIRSVYKKIFIKKVITKCEADIIINRKSGSRTSIVNWKESNIMNSNIDETDWLHIMYLDKLESLDKNLIISFAKKSKFISADLCLSKQKECDMKRLYEIFPFIDYLIISDVEANGIRNILYRSKNIIIHSPKGIYFNNDFIKNIYYKQIVKNALGAGDTFAATFVSNKILGLDDFRSIHIANIKSSNYVLGG